MLEKLHGLDSTLGNSEEEKGFTPNWTEVVFTITTVKTTKPPTYTIEDTRGKPVPGTFYEQELQTSVQEIYRIERVLKRGKDRLQQCIQFLDTTSRR